MTEPPSPLRMLLSRHTKRREFITLLGGAVAWPLAARAQQPELPVVGFLHPATPDTFADRLRAFRQGLKDTGYVEGESVAIVYRWGENQPERMPDLAADLAQRRPTVMACAGGFRSIAAIQAATTTIPIVFAVAEDPVRLGLVTSLARPGGNLTGINFLNDELVAKRLQILRELVPGAARVAVLVNPSGTTGEATTKDLDAAARTIGLQVRILNASNSAEIDTAFASLAND
jgi:putative ABC transport system substrate-binding protein